MTPENYHIVALSCRAQFEILNDMSAVLSCIDGLIQAGNFTKLGHLSHSFEPHGITAVALLSESHIAVHTWPETGMAKIVIATCSNETDVSLYKKIISSTLKAMDIKVSELKDV
jgi:S-adenosylmethionine decarboxylase